MAIIGIRDLVRASKDIIARVENDNEPFLITRHGQPVAALVPVDAADAERYILAAAPELIQTRDEVAAGGEGAVASSLEEVAREFGVESEGDATPEPVAASYAVNSGYLRPRYIEYLFGEHLAHVFEQEAADRLDSITTQVVRTAEGNGLLSPESDAERAAVTVRVRNLNHRLFSSALHEVLADTVVKHVEGGEGAERAPGETLANDALNTTTAYVDAVNRSIFEWGEETSGEFSFSAYEISLRAGIEALGGIHRFAGLPTTRRHLGDFGVSGDRSGPAHGDD